MPRAKDPADKFLRAQRDKARRDRPGLAPQMKVSAARALAEAELAGNAAWPAATEEDIRKLLVLNQNEIAMLNAMTNGKPPRNAQAILAAIRLKLEYSMKKPQIEVADDKKPVNVTITMLGAPVTTTTTGDLPSPAPEKDTIQ
jgi:hypothetical protein